MKRILLSLVLVCSMLGALACERRGGETGGSETGPIRVGVYADLSGQTSSFGQSTVNGIRMAADEINRAGGINGRQIELVVEDDQGLPNQAATVVTKLINQDRVHAVLGEVASSNTLAAAPIAQRAHIPMITPSSTNPTVTQVGDYIFRVCFTDTFQGEAAARFAYNTLIARRAAVLTDVNSDYSRGFGGAFKTTFTRLGGQIIQEQSYQQTDADFSGVLTGIRAANPDVIFIPGYYGQVGVIARQARQLNITAPLLGGDGWDAPQLFQLGGQALNGASLTNHYSVDDPSPRVQEFAAAFRGRYSGTAPDAIAALAYDAMKVLAEAVRRAGTTDGQRLRDAIAQTSNYAGITGNITINSERNAVKSVIVLEVRDGRFIYRETIQPEGAPASGTSSPASGASPTGSPAASPTVSPATGGASPSPATSPATNGNSRPASPTP